VQGRVTQIYRRFSNFPQVVCNRTAPRAVESALKPPLFSRLYRPPFSRGSSAHRRTFSESKLQRIEGCFEFADASSAANWESSELAGATFSVLSFVECPEAAEAERDCSTRKRDAAKQLKSNSTGAICRRCAVDSSTANRFGSAVTKKRLALTLSVLNPNAKP
jgi:hypothetical protein